MAKIARSALVNYSSEQMFTLINDIESYPAFMSGCLEASVLSADNQFIEASLVLGKGGFQQQLVTRNELFPPEKMVMRLVQGPFKQFEGVWAFQALDDTSCKVSLDLEFVFSNPILGLSVGKLLEEVASRQVDSLCQRAKSIYNG